MTRRLRNLILALLTALMLAAGYGTAQSATQVQAPQLQPQTQEDDGRDVGENKQESDGAEDHESDRAEDAEGAEETDETEEADSASHSSNPAAIGTYGSVSLQEVISRAQAELGTQNAPFEVTLEPVNGTLTWALDFVNPKVQVVLDANSGAITATSALGTVPSTDAALTSYGSLSLEDAVRLAQAAYVSPADVTEIALEKDAQNGNVLTWRIDVGGKLVVLDPDSGKVLSVGALN